jgi:hypothetical protein
MTKTVANATEIEDQMIKLNCGFSRKVGEANYGSRGASVNLELELATDAASDANSLNDKIRRLFALAKKAVDDELNGQSAPAEASARGAVLAQGADGNGGNGDGQPGNGSSTAATNKQVKLIMDLARTRKMNLSVVERLCQETCGVSDVYGLTKSQASAVIDRLKADNPAPAGRR